MDPFIRLIRELQGRDIRFVVIGVWGANYWAHSGSVAFETIDRDLFLPLDPTNLVRAWEAATAAGLSLWVRDEPLDSPRDLWLAERIVARRALVRGTDHKELHVDFTLVMAGFDFETVWNERRIFEAEGAEVPVARLEYIVQSKVAADRPKDRLFLATHEEALNQLLGKKD